MFIKTNENLKGCGTPLLGTVHENEKKIIEIA